MARERVHQTWERITGRPWRDARAAGYTDGTAASNLALQRALRAGWRPGDRQHLGDTGEPMMTGYPYSFLRDDLARDEGAQQEQQERVPEEEEQQPLFANIPENWLIYGIIAIIILKIIKR